MKMYAIVNEENKRVAIIIFESDAEEDEKLTTVLLESARYILVGVDV